MTKIQLQMKRALFFIIPFLITGVRAQQPNILFILADDQRADAVGYSGNGYIRTPNIDAVAREGTVFANAYVMGGHIGAICAPSRAMLMSGKSLFNVYDKLDGVTTMPMYFHANGYETFGTGKWHNGIKTFEASFQRGENVFIGGMCNHYEVPCRSLVDGKLTAPTTKAGYSTDLFADAAIQYLTQYASGDQKKPFFCYVAFTAPHDPRSPREDDIGMYEADQIPLPGNYKPYHPFAFDNMQIRDEHLAPWPRTPAVIRESLADYYALISHLDKRFGDIINTLKEQGLFEQTIIVYAADNGLAIGSHGLLGKQNLYEHSMKVPLIISGPGVPKTAVSDALVYLFDVFPTMTALCGLPAPNGVDGMDLKPVITGEAKQVRNSLFTVYRHTVRAVRTTDWKLIRYPERDITQLFDLKKDPLEIHDLSKDTVYGDKMAEMLKLLKGWQREAGDKAPLTASELLPAAYDPAMFKQVPDKSQPPYILEKYF